MFFVSYPSFYYMILVNLSHCVLLQEPRQHDCLGSHIGLDDFHPPKNSDSNKRSSDYHRTDKNTQTPKHNNPNKLIPLSLEYSVIIIGIFTLMVLGQRYLLLANCVSLETLHTPTVKTSVLSIALSGFSSYLCSVILITLRSQAAPRHRASSLHSVCTDFGT